MIRLKVPAVLAMAAILSGALLSNFGVANAVAKRDPKTGRFIKSTTPTKMAPKAKATPKAKAKPKMASKMKPKKALPPRDPKTGRFMKKTAAPTPAKK